MFVNAGGIVAAQGIGLRAGFIVAGVDEIGGLSTGFGGEIPEGQHAGAHHKYDKFFLIGHAMFLLIVLSGLAATAGAVALLNQRFPGAGVVLPIFRIHVLYTGAIRQMKFMITLI